MIEEVTREEEVVGSNLAGCVACEYCVKNATTCLIFFPFVSGFFDSNFAVGPKNGPRQMWLCQFLFAVLISPCVSRTWQIKGIR